ncbi:enterotoxin type B (plasmid) [Staphylococcus aureus]|uniref:exotoxin beta-grasp domain-containing protein n=1 Tax=Staphylococcus aureus TaxID=1280 RepID=UPI0021D39843|nr:exotoxin OB-fold domain-containing protein [Staphylococcus aureus]UXV48994.1 enterotoxin type B [Staphylococcus aureus]UXV54419.1 enterotoxin type B [Staphylococcus aureus]UXV57092.1 enterotoxin type B [Staphylococcus aureus]
MRKNFKKLIKNICVASLAVLTILIIGADRAEAQPDPEPGELHKSSQFTGLMENLRVLYDDYHVEASNVSTVEQFLNFDLIFPIVDHQLHNYDKVRIEFADKLLADKFKGKNVDVFGTNYYRHCYFSEEDKNEENETNGAKNKTCMYGGVTKHDDNHYDSSDEPSNAKNVLVQVFIDKVNVMSFDIQTNKKQVTAQELDYKARNYLIKHKNLYEFKNSPYETGYIKFIENGNESFWYDLMPSPGKTFDQFRYLMIYNDNKIVDSNKTKIQVFLTKK